MFARRSLAFTKNSGFPEAPAREDFEKRSEYGPAKARTGKKGAVYAGQMSILKLFSTPAGQAE